MCASEFFEEGAGGRRGTGSQVALPLPTRVPLTFDMGERTVDIGMAEVSLSGDGRWLLVNAVIRGIGHVEGRLPVPVVAP